MTNTITISEYEKIRENPLSRMAQARISGALRGGTVLGEVFYSAVRGDVICARVSDLSDLSVLGDVSNSKSERL